MNEDFSLAEVVEQSRIKMEKCYRMINSIDSSLDEAVASYDKAKEEYESNYELLSTYRKNIIDKKLFDAMKK